MTSSNREGKLYAAEKNFEKLLFASRWLMAPMYLCLVISLGLLTVIFVRETAVILPNVFVMTADTRTSCPSWTLMTSPTGRRGWELWISLA
jgi:hypothetical protein